jgi:hypothetical protein
MKTSSPTSLTALAPAPLSRLAVWLPRLRRLALSIAGIAVLVAFIYGFENLRGWRAWSSERDRLIASGGKLAVEDFLPPPVPDERNFAMIPLLRPLFELNPDRRATNRWLDPKANQRAIQVLRFDLIHGNSQEPSRGDWRQGKPYDLPGWQAYFRTPGRNLRVDNEYRQRYGLESVPKQPAGETNALSAYPLPPTPGAPAEDVLRALAVFEADFAAIREGLQLPDSRFAIPYEDGYEAILPHLAVLKRWAMSFALRATARIAAGDAAGALSDVEDGLRLAECLRTEPLFISQLVRQAYLGIALQPIWEGLIGRAWSESQLSALQTRLAALDITGNMRAALGLERAQFFQNVEPALGSIRARLRLLQLFTAFGSAQHDPEDEFRLALYFVLAPRGWLYASTAETSRALGQLEDLDPRLIPGLVDRWTESVRNPSWRFTLHNAFINQGLSFGFARGAVKTYAREVDRRLSVTACALERYRLRHGGYPETLDVLAPEFLTSIPLDPILGQPLRYTREAPDRFRLWSVGEDGVNDGGLRLKRPTDTPEAEAGDWVWAWPEAATP